MHQQLSNGSIRSRLISLSKEYPPSLIDDQAADVGRITYHIELIKQYADPPARVCDIGGGLGLLTPGCAAFGFKCTLVDDFRDEINLRSDNRALEVHRRYGVSVLSRDLTADPLDFEPNTFKIITAMDVLEHLHHSPKKLLHGLKRALVPDGVLIISMPNCCNLRKRISSLLGTGHWSAMKDWYEPEIFRAHVREPNISDLRYICRDLDMNILKISGRNWLGGASYPTLRKIADPLLRLRPSLCSNLYLVAGKR